MYSYITNGNYGIANTTYSNYVVISNPDYLTYDLTQPSIYHTGSVDYYRYNKGGDTHELINTLTRPMDLVDILLASETGSDVMVRIPIHTEKNNYNSPGFNSDLFTLFNSVSNQYYSISVVGSTGYETIQINITGSTNASTVQLYNSDTNSYYTISITGTIGYESISIQYLSSTPYPLYLTSPIFLNPTNNSYYTLTVQGTVGNEVIRINPIDNTQALEVESGNSYDLQNSFGAAVDLYKTNLIIGCPSYIQREDFQSISIQSSGSSVYVFDIAIVNTISTYDNLISIISNPTNVSNSFGTSVAINEDWVAVGSPLENGGDGVVYIYNYQYGNLVLFQTITSPTSGANFGHSIKLNKDANTLSGRLVIGCGNIFAAAAYYFEFDSVWSLVYTFTPDYNTYPLTFGNYLPYISNRNSGSGFGNSISIYGDTVVVGEYLDRVVYEYSGSLAYNQGSVSIFQKCNPSSSYFELVYKTYGNENTIQNNNFGYSVDIWNDYVIAGCPKSNQLSLSSSYVGNTIFQLYECDNSTLNYLNGQSILIQNTGGEWNILNVYQKKKQYLSPYRAVGHNVAIGDFSFIMGAPILLTDTNRMINIPITQSQYYTLDDLSGKSYIYNFHNLQETFHIGNVFYRNGKLVMMTSGSIFQNLFGQKYYSYNLNFDSQTTIYEKQIICSIDPGEFNVSTNPTATNNPIATFDLNSNRKFDFEDLDILMRYMKYKNNQILGLSYSTDWSSSIVLNDDEQSLYNYYTNNSNWNNTHISEMVNYYIQQWDFVDTSIQTDLDFNSDNIIDIRDMNILWKYFSNRLNQSNYNKYTTPNSGRTSISQLTDYLDNLTGKSTIPMISSQFFNYNQQIENDITGSFCAPMITSIGLYDNNYQLVAVGKLGTPIKNGNNIPLNILMRMDF